MRDLIVWHGSRRWEGSPSIMPSRKGQYEHGPGIYCTTNLNTAAKYTKGGGRFMRFHISPEVTWLEDVRIPFDAMISFVKQARHLHRRQVLLADIHAMELRHDLSSFRDSIPLSWLVNLSVNNEALSGKATAEMAEFLTSQGAQASLWRKSTNDDWVVIFDPKIITCFEILSSKEIDWKSDELPSISAQLEAIKIANTGPGL